MPARFVAFLSLSSLYHSVDFFFYRFGITYMCDEVLSFFSPISDTFVCARHMEPGFIGASEIIIIFLVCLCSISVVTVSPFSGR